MNPQRLKLQLLSILLATGLCLSGMVLRSAEAQGSGTKITSMKLKVGFILNFAKFVEWPEEAFEAQQDSLTFCGVGLSDFTPIFQSLDGRNIRGRTARVSLRGHGDSLTGCQLAYFPEKAQVPEIQAARRKNSSKPILIVTNQVESGMINLFLSGNKLRFEIYPERVEKAGLRMSSQLLKLAEIREGT